VVPVVMPPVAPRLAPILFLLLLPLLLHPGGSHLKTYTYTEARRRLAALLDEAQRTGRVQIRRRDGQLFVLQPATQGRSPLDVPGVSAGLLAGDSAAWLREERRAAGDHQGGQDAVEFDRITTDPGQMGGLPCIRGLRIPVATVVDMVADGMTPADIVDTLQDLQVEDIEQALHYAAESVR